MRYKSASMPETVELHFSNGLFDQDNAALGDFGCLLVAAKRAMFAIP